MKKILHTFAACFAAIILLMPNLCFALEDRTINKVISDFDENYTAEIKLSASKLKAANTYDIMFILDSSEVSTETTVKFIEIIEALQQEIEGRDVHVKVAFTMFKGTSVGTEWIDVSTTSFNEIKSRVTTMMMELMMRRKGGTNMPAALLQAKEILESDTTVPNANKSLFFITDGIGFEFVDEGLTDAYNAATKTVKTADNGVIYKPYEMGWVISKYESASTEDSEVLKPGDNTTQSWSETEWNNYFNWVENNYQDYLQYAFNYHNIDDTFTSTIPAQENIIPVTGVDLDIYQTNLYFNQLAEKYNAYAIPLPTTSGFWWGTYFMNFLARNNETDTSAVMAELFNTINESASREQIEDEVITTDNYQFKIINDLSQYTISINNQVLVKTKINDNSYGFGDPYEENGVTKYPIVLSYEKVNDDEHLTWSISSKVTDYENIELTYKIQLKNPEDLQDGDILKPATKTTIKSYNAKDKEIYDGSFNEPTLEFVKPEEQPVVDDEPVIDEEDENGEYDEPQETPSESEDLEEIDIPIPNTGDNLISYILLAIGSVATLAVASRFAFD